MQDRAQQDPGTAGRAAAPTRGRTSLSGTSNSSNNNKDDKIGDGRTAANADKV